MLIDTDAVHTPRSPSSSEVHSVSSHSYVRAISLITVSVYVSGFNILGGRTARARARFVPTDDTMDMIIIKIEKNYAR